MRIHPGFLGSAAACVFFAATQEGRAQLAQTSPFLAPSSAVTAGALSDGHSLELRGVTSGPDGTLFCIYDPQKKSSVWVGLREKGYPFVVASADPDRDQIRLMTQDGRTLSLTLRESKVSATPAAAAGPALAVGGAQPAPPVDEALNAARQEMARKRMERLQAMKAARAANPPQQ